MLTVGQEHSFPIEVNADNIVAEVTFTTSGEYLVVRTYIHAAQVWRLKDAKQVATIDLPDILALALSKDDTWIAVGTIHELFLLDAKTYQKVFTHKEVWFQALDSSPDSSRLVTGADDTAIVWDVTTRKQVRRLHHGEYQFVKAVKYSPQGDRIATATWTSVRVWDGNNGRLPVDIPQSSARYETGFHWFSHRLVVLSDGKIKEFSVSTGSPVSEWPIADRNGSSRIALPKHGEFIAYATNNTVTFCDSSTRTQFGLIHYTQNIASIAFSSDDRLLAIGGNMGEITIKEVKDVLPPSSCSYRYLDGHSMILTS